MNVKDLVNKALTPTGFAIYRSRGARTYSRDGLFTSHNHDFIRDPHFKTAYSRGVRSASSDYNIEWRAHIAFWAAFTASKLTGDFVECGVNWGFMSSAIMEYLDWNRLDKTFYLLDTFSGIDERLLTVEERAAGAMKKNDERLRRGFYTANVESVRKNFDGWNNVEIIQGVIPESLSQVQANRVAFLHIDMNCAAPEIAALEFFWPKLVPGAMVLLDDYGHRGHAAQKQAMDECAQSQGAMVASLPTGQGLIIKPAI